MTVLFRSIQAFFFAEHSATGFRLMRRAWAAVTLLFLLFQWNDVTAFYSDAGLFPWSIAETMVRANYHFTLFTFVTSPAAVFSVYLLFLGILLCMMLNVFPRITTILGVLLLFSFHERDPMILGGGDTLLRAIGFILMLWSTVGLACQTPTSRSPISGLRSPIMPKWPYRLLLWQMIILYGTSFWYKLLGTLWIAGSAVEISLHHPLFVRWPMSVMNLVTPIAPIIDYTSLAFEGLWLLLLIPRWLTDLLPARLPRIPLKRILILIGLFFHGGIFVLMDAGSFSLAVFVAYCGLLQEDDVRFFHSFLSRKKQHRS